MSKRPIILECRYRGSRDTWTRWGRYATLENAVERVGRVTYYEFRYIDLSSPDPQYATLPEGR